ncbi:hypothetical protein [Lentzea sp. CA-135723]|uniref:hypothetical protein n=1 Tax=Lentzea sp. CA-135723 TaxID=3239950 RepID=UPI003D8BF561
MFLLCLFAAYLIVRLWEDTTATIRREPPPRHAYRMAKLAARDATDRPAPTSKFRRYATGLLDDAWDSAHHKRELMADHRADKRARKAAAKIAKERGEWAAEDGTPPDPAGFDAVAPEVAPAEEAPTAPPTPAPFGSAGTSIPAEPPLPARATGPTSPVPGSTPRSSVDPGSVAFEWTATVPELSDLPDDVPPVFRKPYGRATRDLAEDLTRRCRLVPEEASFKGYDELATMSTEQRELAQRWSDSLATGCSTWSMSTADWMALPLPVRVDLLDDIRRSPTASIITAPGEEDVEALALLARRHGGHLDPSEIYSALEDLPPAARERVLEAQARRQAERTAAEATATTSTETATSDSTDPAVFSSADTDAPREELTGNDPAASTSDDTITEESTTETSNVIPIRRSQPTTTPAIPIRMELPMTSTEITGLESAITYAGQMQDFCTSTFEQISAAVPNGDEAAASCELAHANLVNGGVTGQALTDIASVQEQVVGAARELEAALAKYELAAAGASSLKSTLESHRTVQDAYNATPDAGNKEFVTTH